jgi:hypothetical protein
MKRQTILSIAFSIFAVNAFAATSVQPVVAEGGSDRLIESRVAEGGSIENRVAADGSDRLQGTPSLPMAPTACKATLSPPMARPPARQHRRRRWLRPSARQHCRR